MPGEVGSGGVTVHQHVLTVTLPDNLYAHLMRRAEEEGSPKTAIVRQLIYRDMKKVA